MTNSKKGLKPQAGAIGGPYYSFAPCPARMKLAAVIVFGLLSVGAAKAPEDELAKEMTHDLEMNFNKIASFGKEDTAK